MAFLLDIGGEGRHERAWNLNPSRVKTFGARRGEPIPRLIQARAEAIPLPDSSVNRILMERTPLRKAALYEMARVIAPGGEIVLRHAKFPRFDPHSLAQLILPGKMTQTHLRMGVGILQETRFLVPQAISR